MLGISSFARFHHFHDAITRLLLIEPIHPWAVCFPFPAGESLHFLTATSAQQTRNVLE